MAAGDTLRKITPNDQLIVDVNGNVVGVKSPNANGADLRFDTFMAARVAPRNPYAFAILGNSRMANVYRDGPNQRRKTNISWFNWANALLGQRMIISGLWAVSGQRTDEYLSATNIAAALATNAKYFVMGDIVNDVRAFDNTYDYFSGPGNGGFVGVKGICDQIIAAGGVPVLVTEMGSISDTSTARLSAINIYNQKVRQYAREKAGSVILFDIARLTLDSTVAPTAFKSGYSYDGTHLDVPAAKVLGTAFANILSPLIPALEQGPQGQLEVFANGGVCGLTNPLFTTTTGGTGGTGITGSIPASWAIVHTAGYSTASSVAAGPVGNEVTLAITASAAGTSRIQQAIASIENIGELWEGLVEVDIASGFSNLGGVWIDLERSADVFVNAQDMYWDAAQPYANLPAGAITGLRLRTPAFPIQSGTRNYWVLRIWASFSAAGSATITIRQPALRKLLTL